MHCATFGDVELRNLRRSHLEQWVKTMDSNGLAPQTIHSRMMVIKTVLRAAVRDRRMIEDPSVGVILPRRRRKEQAMVIPSPEDVGKLYQTAEPWFRAFIGLCAFAGLRLGEGAAVQVGDIDFLRRTLKVQRQVQKEPTKDMEIRAPKYGSERSVPLADGLLTILSQHISEVGVYGDDQWLFPGENGLPPKPRRISYQWDKTIELAGVDKINLHSLRHFYASGLIASGCDVVTVQRALGHSEATTTLNTYSHLWPDAEDRTRNAADAMLNGALGIVGTDIPADSLRTLASK
ncbi:tyrosine-type recombinase/integrase [Arthrobacter sp. TMN-50]